jgi:hypothetical protein
MRNTLMIMGFAALTVVAAAGWMRQPNQVMPNGTASALEGPSTVNTPVSAAVYTQPVRRTPVVRYRTVSDEADQPQFSRRSSEQQIGRDTRYRDESDARYRNEPDARYRDEPMIRSERSKGKSIAIIAGTAAAGAAIGGLAGHGKGAAIGALSGAALGTVYDRMTHKNTDGWGWKR